MNGKTVYPITTNSSSLISDSFNNKYVYSIPSGSVKFQKSKVALVDSSGDYVYFLTFRKNPTYYSIEVDTFAVPTAAQLAGLGYTNPNAIPLPVAATTTQLIVPSTLLRNSIGYTAGSYPTVQAATTKSFLSSFTPQVFQVQSLTLVCILFNNKYANPRTILFSFSPQVGFGSVIDVRPNEFFWVDIQDGNYASFQIGFLISRPII